MTTKNKVIVAEIIVWIVIGILFVSGFFVSHLVTTIALLCIIILENAAKFKFKETK